VWRDPVCGDGLCETPFEFASYGRFGCRADCGNLIDLEALASVDIDLYWDFSHQPGSLPAAVSGRAGRAARARSAGGVDRAGRFRPGHYATDTAGKRPQNSAVFPANNRPAPNRS
jgi:hypothetical protein